MRRTCVRIPSLLPFSISPPSAIHAFSRAAAEIRRWPRRAIALVPLTILILVRSGYSSWVECYEYSVRGPASWRKVGEVRPMTILEESTNWGNFVPLACIPVVMEATRQISKSRLVPNDAPIKIDLAICCMFPDLQQ